MPSSEAPYKNPSSSSISLDTISNATNHFSGKWTPELKRNQSQQLLIHLLGKWFIRWPDNIFKGGNPFHARVRASHAALGAHLDLTREWTCKCVKKLRDAKWIVTKAPRLPNGKQEVTTYQPGKMLKRLLVKLVNAKQPRRVNDQSQKFPQKEDREKNKALFAQLIIDVGKNKDLNKTIRW